MREPGLATTRMVGTAQWKNLPRSIQCANHHHPPHHHQECERPIQPAPGIGGLYRCSNGLLLIAATFQETSVILSAILCAFLCVCVCVNV
jgi:hypothetical protein